MESPGRDSSLPDRPLDEESLFDDYSSLALRGVAPPPSEFLTSHPSASAELRASLERVFQRAPRGAVEGDKLPFERLGDYRLVKRIGGGGMGVVYLAVQESLGREVALKVLRPELQGSAVAAERFRREARALAELRHEHLVSVYGGGEEHGVRYLAMELVPGTTLDELLVAEPGPPRGGMIARRVRWLEGVARGLQHAHEKGVVHRDVKPANLRITPDDRARLLDFGLARQAGSEAITLTQSFAGSPSYAAPEQIGERGAIDARTDVYALGVTLYQCLTGRPPFEGATVEQLFRRILEGAPEPPRRLVPELPRDLETVTLKAMERDPARRYATAGELADDLAAVLELRAIRGRPPSVLERTRRFVQRHPLLATAATTGVAALLVLAFVLVAQRDARERARREEAARLVDSARARVADYRVARESLALVQGEVQQFREQMEAQYFNDAQYALLDRHEGDLEDRRRDWETTYYEVLDLLRQAERLDPAVAGADSVRSGLYLARYQEALQSNDSRAAEFFRDLAARSDPAVAAELGGEATASITTDPPGAELHLLRFEEESRLEPDGEPRMVCVPLSGASPRPPGTWCLRLDEDAPPLLRGDHVVEIAGEPIEGALFVLDGGGRVATGARLVAVDGAPLRDDWDLMKLSRDPPAVPPRRFEFRVEGAPLSIEAASYAELAVTAGGARRFARDAARAAVPCRVVRDGQEVDALLPPAAPAEATARPLFLSAATRVGTTPCDVRVARGDYLFVALHPERALVRLATPLSADHQFAIALPRRDEAPDGFCFVPQLGPASPPSFWMAQREVDAAEWQEFLDEAAAAAPLVNEGRLRLVPRMSNARPFWPQDESGRFHWSLDWRADWPVLGISFDDATNYVAWLNQRRPPRDPAFEWALPSHAEHLAAATGALPWRYVYGWRLRPRWSRCCYARPFAGPGPVLEFPVDESPYGVFDLTGGALEWLDHWYDERRGLRFATAGAWGQAGVDFLAVSGGRGIEPQMTSGETGLRLVLRRKPVAAAAEPPK